MTRMADERRIAPWIDTAYVRDVLRRRWWGLAGVALVALVLGDEFKGVRGLVSGAGLWATIGATLMAFDLGLRNRTRFVSSLPVRRRALGNALFLLMALIPAVPCTLALLLSWAYQVCFTRGAVFTLGQLPVALVAGWLWGGLALALFVLASRFDTASAGSSTQGQVLPLLLIPIMGAAHLDKLADEWAVVVAAAAAIATVLAWLTAPVLFAGAASRRRTKPRDTRRWDYRLPAGAGAFFAGMVIASGLQVAVLLLALWGYARAGLLIPGEAAPSDLVQFLAVYVLFGAGTLWYREQRVLRALPFTAGELAWYHVRRFASLFAGMAAGLVLMKLALPRGCGIAIMPSVFVHLAAFVWLGVVYLIVMLQVTAGGIMSFRGVLACAAAGAAAFFVYKHIVYDPASTIRSYADVSLLAALVLQAGLVLCASLVLRWQTEHSSRIYRGALGAA